MTTIFLSYSRNDDEPFVKRLYDDLSRRGFDVWWDRISMPARGLTFLHEIRDAIDARERFLLVLGPKATTSDYVIAEWQHAVTYGKAINPILRLGDFPLVPDELKLLHVEDFRDDTRYAFHLENLVRHHTLKVWDAETGRAVSTLAGHTSWVSACAYSSDERRIVSGSEDKTLKVWDAETEEEVATFFAEGFNGQADQSKAGCSIAAGNKSGRVHLLRPVGFEIAAPIVTPVHLHRFDKRRWDSQPTAKCEWCGQRFAPIPVVLAAIAGIARTAHLSPEQSPCLALPAEAWDEPQLLCECPHCHEPLKCNPFVVDNRD